MDLSKFGDFGIIGVIIGCLFFIVWRWSVWIMGWIKDRDKMQADERIAWMSRIEKMNDLTNKISDSIDNHDRRSDERGRFVRSEHEKMIANLEEQGKVLARMNGYRKE